MKPGWTEVALGEVLTPRTDTCVIHQDTEYREVTVAVRGKGVRLRRKVLGAGIAAPFRNVAKTGDFIISKIDARHGAFGFIPNHLDGAVVTNDFPLFAVRSEKLMPRWLYWITQSHFFTELCKAASAGSTNRVRLDEGKFRELPIPLPPLADQQRLAARLDAIETRLTRVAQLREEIADAHITLLVNLATRPDLSDAQKTAAGWQEIALRDVMSAANDPVAVSATENYPNLGLLNFARGTFTKAPINGGTSSATTLFRVRAGQFIYSRLFAFEGAYGIVREDQDGVFVSNEFPAFDLDRSRVLAEFLFAYFKSPVIWRELAEQATGLGDRRRRVHPDIVLSHRLFLPPIQYQTKMQRVVARIATCTEPEAATTALLPSLLDQIFNQ